MVAKPKPKPTPKPKAPLVAQATVKMTPARDEAKPARDLKKIAELERHSRILDLVEQHSDMNYRQIADLARQELGEDMAPTTIQAIVDDKLARARERISSQSETLRAKRVAELDIIRDRTLKIAEATNDYHALDIARKCVEAAARLEVSPSAGSGVLEIELRIPGYGPAPALDDGNTVTVTPEEVG